MEESIQSASARWLRVALFFAFTLALLAGCYAYFRYETDRIRQEKYQEIAAIGKLKAGQLLNWRQERLKDLSRSSRAPFFNTAVEEWLRNQRDPFLREQMQRSLVVQQKEEGYWDVLLLDTEGHTILAARTQQETLSSTAKRAVEQAVLNRAPTLSDLYRSPHGAVYLDAVAPLVDSEGRPVAALALRSDAESHLYPLIQSWPTASKTAETLLVRKKGEDVRFLNDLRHRPNSALSLHQPLSLKELPAAQAVLGRQGVFEGIDYRGVEVLADLRAIPESPWFMVAKVDASEILAEARYRGAVIALFALLFLLLAAGVTAYGYRYREARLYRNLYRSERQIRAAQDEFRTTLYSIGDAVITTDTKGLVKQMNPVAERLTGWLAAEAGGKPLHEVFRIVNEESRGEAENPAERFSCEGTLVGPANHASLIAKDASERHIAVSGAPISDKNGAIAGVVLVFRDQTRERAAAKLLRESEERFSKSFASNPALLIIIHMGTHKVLEVNDAWTRICGYTREEAIGSTPVELGIYDEEAYCRIVEEAKAKGSVRNVEVNFKTRTGENRVLLVSREVIEIRNEPYLLSMGMDITDRKRSEEALRVSEERFSKAFRNSPDAMTIVRQTDGRLIEVNERFVQVSGYSREEALGRTAIELNLWLDPADRDRYLAALAEQGGLRDFETEFRSKTGETRSYFASGETIDVDGESCILGIFHDITKRRHAEEMLRQAEQRYRSLFEDAPLMYVITRNEQGVPFVSDCNEMFLESVGYSRDEVVGQPLTHFYSPESRSDLLEGGGYTRALAGEFFMGERQLLTRDGRLIPTLLYTATEVDTAGQVIGTRAMFVDITERRKAEGALRFERRQLLSIFESINEVIIVIDPQTYEILYANRFTEELYGKSLVGKNCYVELNCLETPCKHCPNEQVMDLRGRPYQREYHSSVLDRDFLATDRMIRWPDGRDVKFQLAIDVTERNRAEQEKENLSTQLLQAQKMEAVGTLAGGVAHDFNNLLQVVLGYSELILDDDRLPALYRADLEKMNQAARNGADLVQRLLTFSRKTEAKPRPLNLNRRIEQLQRMLSRTIPRMIDIELILADDLAAINADPTQMEQVMMNLAVNARDAMPEGGKLVIQTENVTFDELYCKSHLGTKPGRHVMLSVSDTGQGMDKDTVQHIFEPFFSTKAPGEGTGLGLAMVYGIVKHHNGHILCYSEPSHGTVFKIFFPALVAEEKSPETQTRALPKGGSETILIVDDEELIRDLAARILTKAGYKVVATSNGKEAVEMYQANRDEISLVLLDLIMPEMGGKQCLEELLNISPEAKVIIASGYSESARTEESMDVGAKGFVAKPYDLRQLLETVRNVLDS